MAIPVHDPQFPPSEIAGIVMAPIVLMAFLFALIVWLRYRRRTQRLRELQARAQARQANARWRPFSRNGNNSIEEEEDGESNGRPSVDDGFRNYVREMRRWDGGESSAGVVISEPRRAYLRV